MKYAMDYHVVPVLTATSSTAAATFTAGVNMTHYNWVDFIFSVGILTGDVITLTVHESTSDATTGALALPFVYRMSSPVGTDSMGTATTATSAGCTVAASDDDTSWIISVDPRTMTEGYNYLRVCVAEGSSSSASVKHCLAILSPKYAQETPLSSS